MPLRPFQKSQPRLGARVFVAENATVIGDVMYLNASGTSVDAAAGASVSAAALTVASAATGAAGGGATVTAC